MRKREIFPYFALELNAQNENTDKLYLVNCLGSNYVNPDGRTSKISTITASFRRI